ncbi:MAG: hypothetical protein QW134_07275 [Nitrososphaeria archaeon]
MLGGKSKRIPKKVEVKNTSTPAFCPSEGNVDAENLSCNMSQTEDCKINEGRRSLKFESAVDNEYKRPLEGYQKSLEIELERLKKVSNLGVGLKVKWVPDETKNVHGEVLNNMIYVYDTEFEKAIETLRHEFLDYVVTKGVIEPLVAVINMLIKCLEAKVYVEKEKLTEGLISILHANEC